MGGRCRASRRRGWSSGVGGAGELRAVEGAQAASAERTALAGDAGRGGELALGIVAAGADAAEERGEAGMHPGEGAAGDVAGREDGERQAAQAGAAVGV